MRARMGLLAASVMVIAMMAPSAHAVHWYRGPGGGCTPANGELTDDSSPSTPVAATVLMLHNSFNDAATGRPVTTIKVGQAVRWTWNSAHCHSVDANDLSFRSGFRYPTTAPSSPQAIPGLFEYPVLEDHPTLAFTHTFTTPGTFRYGCVHHATIGMIGVIIVE